MFLRLQNPKGNQRTALGDSVPMQVARGGMHELAHLMSASVLLIAVTAASAEDVPQTQYRQADSVSQERSCKAAIQDPASREGFESQRLRAGCRESYGSHDRQIACVGFVDRGFLLVRWPDCWGRGTGSFTIVGDAGIHA